MNQFEYRVEVLERSVRRWKALYSLTIVLLLSLFLLAADPIARPDNHVEQLQPVISAGTLRCRSLIVENENGEAIAMLGKNEGTGATLTLGNVKLNHLPIALSSSTNTGLLSMGNADEDRFGATLMVSNIGASMSLDLLTMNRPDDQGCFLGLTAKGGSIIARSPDGAFTALDPKGVMTAPAGP